MANIFISSNYGLFARLRIIGKIENEIVFHGIIEKPFIGLLYLFISSPNTLRQMYEKFNLEAGHYIENMKEEIMFRRLKYIPPSASEVTEIIESIERGIRSGKI